MNALGSPEQIHLALLRLKCRIVKKIIRSRGNDRYESVWERVRQYKSIWEEAAQTLSAELNELSEGFWEVRRDDCLTRLYNHIVPMDDPVTLAVADNKPLSLNLLRKNGLPVPRHATFRLHELFKARVFIEETGGLFVVKPAHGTSGGKGITTHLEGFSECRDAAVLASLYGMDLMIEEFIPGESYRILVLDGEVIHASRRCGLRVTGDGFSTIGQLAEQESLRGRGSRKESPTERFTFKRDFRTTVQAQNIDVRSVPEAGRVVLVAGQAEVGAGKEVRTRYDEDVTLVLCDDLKNQAIGAAKTIGSRFAGVDVITTDPLVSLEKSHGAINEVNTTPGMHNHYDLVNQGKTPPAVPVLRYLLEKGGFRKNEQDVLSGKAAS